MCGVTKLGFYNAVPSGPAARRRCSAWRRWRSPRASRASCSAITRATAWRVPAPPPATEAAWLARLERVAEADVARTTLAHRRAAARNPSALVRRPLFAADRKKSPYVAEPLRRVDLAAPAAGACAFVVTTADRARRPAPRILRLDAGRAPVARAAAVGLARGDRRSTRSRRAAKAMFAGARVRPGDVGVACLNADASPLVPIAVKLYRVRGGAGEPARRAALRGRARRCERRRGSGAPDARRRRIQVRGARVALAAGLAARADVGGAARSTRVTLTRRCGTRGVATSPLDRPDHRPLHDAPVVARGGRAPTSSGSASARSASRHEARRLRTRARDRAAAGVGAARGARRLVRPLRHDAAPRARGHASRCGARSAGCTRSAATSWSSFSGGRDGAAWERGGRASTPTPTRALLPEATRRGHPARDRGDPSAAPGPVVREHARRRPRDRARARAARGGYVLDLWHSGWERRAAGDDRGGCAAAHPRRAGVRLQARSRMRTLDRALLGKGILPLPRDRARARARRLSRLVRGRDHLATTSSAMGYERALGYTRDAFVRLMSRR